MISSNNLFARLVAEYPTFDALKTHLTGKGIQLNMKEGDPIGIFRYNREKADVKNDPLVRAFRSVLWDSVTNRPVFVAPMKSEPFTTLPGIFSQDMLVEEFVDGVMINVFYDKNTSRWRMATRSRLDADTKFYEHGFNDLFMSTWTGMGLGASLNESPFLQNQKEYGYSFVLQHPANRIVVPCAVPRIVCVEVSAIGADNIVYTQPVMVPHMSPPERFPVSNINELAQLVAGFDLYQGLNRQGLVIKCMSSGQRWKVRSATYSAVRKLRGNHSRLEYVWFDNMRNNTLETYLNAYPEERTNCMAMAASWSKIVSDTYNWYVHAFKVRDASKDTIPAHFKGLLYDLHGYYLTKLAPNKKSLTWEEWQCQMARQDLKRQVFLCTFKTGVTPPPKKTVAPATNKKKQHNKKGATTATATANVVATETMA